MTRDLPANMADRLIVALDVPNVVQAREIVAKLDGAVAFYKIGMWLLYVPGTEKFIDDLIASGKRVFLDAKMHDIGETVRAGAASAAARGVSFLTIHGEPQVIQAAMEGKGASCLKILAVTVLTSLTGTDLQTMGYSKTVPELVAQRVASVVALGGDGIIASAQDDPNTIRAQAGAPNLLIVTPGIRLPGSEAGGQKRISTPAAAIAKGADYLVVGRPIVAAPDPRSAAQLIIADMERGAAE
ncbi:MAG: orotidine-5'-phosphate decarboxylase [Acetobacteraceae bacterium]|nr:orotidine-5'-phosphate decarboxylase [Acetobacteraceae bacterium]MSP28871.1 orotidine-5'-phosphate decarboxylase [Acetobacteraceae bacterium]